MSKNNGVSPYVLRVLELAKNQQADIRRRDLAAQEDRQISRRAFEHIFLAQGWIKQPMPYEWDHFVEE